MNYLYNHLSSNIAGKRVKKPIQITENETSTIKKLNDLNNNSQKPVSTDVSTSKSTTIRPPRKISFLESTENPCTSSFQDSNFATPPSLLLNELSPILNESSPKAKVPKSNNNITNNNNNNITNNINPENETQSPKNNSSQTSTPRSRKFKSKNESQSHSSNFTTSDESAQSDDNSDDPDFKILKTKPTDSPQGTDEDSSRSSSGESWDTRNLVEQLNDISNLVGPEDMERHELEANEDLTTQIYTRKNTQGVELLDYDRKSQAEQSSYRKYQKRHLTSLTAAAARYIRDYGMKKFNVDFNLELDRVLGGSFTLDQAAITKATQEQLHAYYGLDYETILKEGAAAYKISTNHKKNLQKHSSIKKNSTDALIRERFRLKTYQRNLVTVSRIEKSKSQINQEQTATEKHNETFQTFKQRNAVERKAMKKKEKDHQAEQAEIENMATEQRASRMESQNERRQGKKRKTVQEKQTEANAEKVLKTLRRMTKNDPRSEYNYPVPIFCDTSKGVRPTHTLWKASRWTQETKLRALRFLKEKNLITISNKERTLYLKGSYSKYKSNVDMDTIKDPLY